MKTSNRRALLSMALAGLSLTACGNIDAGNLPSLKVMDSDSTGFGTKTTNAGMDIGKVLFSKLPIEERTNTVFVATLTDVDSNRRASTLGRTLSSEVANSLSSLGMKVIDNRISDTVYMSDAGDLILSGAKKDTTKAIKASFAVVGTLSPVGDDVVVSARIVRLKDNLVFASHSVVLKNMSYTSAIGLLPVK